ncbi:hypothetical protein [Olsenella sp. HMSC062G07]|uniref:coiled-coil domain-containing protein n=1 Tax=Olsenella sp. HMSC062G07 TaxID=1739330 RepID=UPI0008A18FEC|nr:hypothetical protein [Olsenella sp. HMSC062G07]
MTANRTRVRRPSLLGRVALVVACACAVPAAVALAEPARLEQDEAAAQQRIEDTARAYDDATRRVEELQRQIDESAAHIDAINSRLPDVRRSAAEGLRGQYRLQEGSLDLMGMILDADSLSDFIESMAYVSSITSHNAAKVRELVDLTHEMEATRQELEDQRAEASQRQKDARDALDQAVTARKELQRQVEEQQAREAAEARAAIEEASAAAARQQTFTNASGAATTIEVPRDEPAPGPDAQGNGDAQKPKVPGGSDAADVSWPADKAAFVDQWTARIDAFLAGSPLAGHGRTFAEAAWDNGVDPRISPAISNTESTKGRYCFRPHNAWGWGSSSWPDWDTAIRAHVRGIARGYGGYLTLDFARKYCPPTYQSWYATTLWSMQQI